MIIKMEWEKEMETISRNGISWFYVKKKAIMKFNATKNNLPTNKPTNKPTNQTITNRSMNSKFNLTGTNIQSDRYQ